MIISLSVIYNTWSILTRLNKVISFTNQSECCWFAAIFSNADTVGFGFYVARYFSPSVLLWSTIFLPMAPFLCWFVVLQDGVATNVVSQNPTDAMYVLQSYPNFFLIFNKVTAGDAGAYSCNATNTHGSVVSGNGLLTLESCKCMKRDDKLRSISTSTIIEFLTCILFSFAKFWFTERERKGGLRLPNNIHHAKQRTTPCAYSEDSVIVNHGKRKEKCGSRTQRTMLHAHCCKFALQPRCTGKFYCLQSIGARWNHDRRCASTCAFALFINWRKTFGVLSGVTLPSAFFFLFFCSLNSLRCLSKRFLLTSNNDIYLVLQNINGHPISIMSAWYQRLVGRRSSILLLRTSWQPTVQQRQYHWRSLSQSWHPRFCSQQVGLLLGPQSPLLAPNTPFKWQPVRQILFFVSTVTLYFKVRFMHTAYCAEQSTNLIFKLCKSSNFLVISWTCERARRDEKKSLANGQYHTCCNLEATLIVQRRVFVHACNCVHACATFGVWFPSWHWSSPIQLFLDHVPVVLPVRLLQARPHSQ